MTNESISTLCPGPLRNAVALGVALGAALCSGQTAAQSQFLAYSAACQSDCAFGPTVFWTPPSGATASSSAARGWSNIAPPGSDPSYNFSVSAAAQASISGVDKWSAHTSASGYFNKAAGSYSNGVAGQGIISVRDEFVLPSTAGWNGPGWFRLSYRITGEVAVNYAETSSVTGLTLGSAQSSITFECGSARVGGLGSSRCESPDFPPPQPGSQNLIGRLNFDTSQSVDRIVTFNLPVFSNQLYAYGLQTTVDSRLVINSVNRSGRVEGGSAADFSHTFNLVNAQLFDAGFNAVPQWSVRSASGFNYAAITAVPEPGTWALLWVGLGAIALRARRQGREQPA
jgi:hypothetical protein